MQTKTEKANVVQPRRMQFGVMAWDLYPSVWVNRLLLTAALARQPMTGFLIRPMTCDRQGFQEAPLDSAAINYVFKQLAAAGVLAGQMPHGIRRGAIQAGVTAGQSREEVMAQAHADAPGVPAVCSPNTAQAGLLRARQERETRRADVRSEHGVSSGNITHGAHLKGKLALLYAPLYWGLTAKPMQVRTVW